MEELERLEQSITLTLQGVCVCLFLSMSGKVLSANASNLVEIDHNFNRAHRTVTGEILPVVEQYAEQSRGVWDGCKVRSSLRGVC